MCAVTNVLTGKLTCWLGSKYSEVNLKEKEAFTTKYTRYR